MPDDTGITAASGWCAPTDTYYDIHATPPPPRNPSKTLLDLLQDAYDAGTDPDLDFNDYLHHAIVGGRLHLEIN